MVCAMAGAPDATGSARSWRVPPYQPAVLLLIVSGCAAVNLYGHPAGQVRFFTIAMGLAAAGLAVAWLRMYLYVDDEGLEVRFLRAASWVPWSSVERIEVATVVGGMTVRLTRHDGTHVDVPPSLLHPSRPTSKPRALAQLGGLVRELEERRARGVR